MEKRIVAWFVGIIGISIIILLVILFLRDINYAIFPFIDGQLSNYPLVPSSYYTWANHNFKVKQIGEVEWKEEGYKVLGNSKVRARITDINLNQKIKVTVKADMQGELKSQNPSCTGECITTQKYHFAEFGLYIVDKNEIKYGVALLGTRNRIAEGNTRNTFNFTEFTLENTGSEIIFTDNTLRKIVLDKNSETHQRLENLNKNHEWNLRINSHVNGEGFTEIKIREIIIEQF